jgi:SSS family solute:Na+ symporter
MEKLSILAVGLYFFTLLWIGWRSKNIISEEEFVLADRKIGLSLLIATTVATFYGASAVIGEAGIAYQIGLGVLWFIIPFYLGIVVVIVINPRIQRLNSLTLPDFLGEYYKNKIVVVSSLLLSCLCLIPATIIAGGKIIQLITPFSLTSGMVLICAIIVIYTVLGGLRSVVISDLIQLGLMLLALVLLIPYFFKVKGVSFVNLPHELWNPLCCLSVQEILVWSILLFFLPITCAPLYQRIFAAMKNVNVRRALLISLFIWVLIDAIILYSGLTSRVNYKLTDPDQAIIVLGMKILPKILQPIFFVGLISAIMSTGDSFLHSGASSLAYDVYRRISQKEGKIGIVGMSRIMVVVLGAISFLLALYFKEIVPALIFTLTVWISGILIPTIAALFNLKLSENAAISSVVVGSITAIFWKFFPFCGIDPLFVGLTCSLFSTIIVHALGKSKREAINLAGN